MFKKAYINDLPTLGKILFPAGVKQSLLFVLGLTYPLLCESYLNKLYMHISDGGTGGYIPLYM